MKDIANRAKRIREDKAVVGIEAGFIEQIARRLLDEKPTRQVHQQ